MPHKILCLTWLTEAKIRVVEAESFWLSAEVWFQYQKQLYVMFPYIHCASMLSNRLGSQYGSPQQPLKTPQSLKKIKMIKRLKLQYYSFYFR